MKKFYDVPTQVLFRIVDDDSEILGGVAYGEVVICGCCGAIIPLDEAIIEEEYPNDWTPISDEIIGN